MSYSRSRPGLPSSASATASCAAFQVGSARSMDFGNDNQRLFDEAKARYHLIANPWEPTHRIPMYHVPIAGLRAAVDQYATWSAKILALKPAALRSALWGESNSAEDALNEQTVLAWLEPCLAPPLLPNRQSLMDNILAPDSSRSGARSGMLTYRTVRHMLLSGTYLDAVIGTLQLIKCLLPGDRRQLLDSTQPRSARWQEWLFRGTACLDTLLIVARSHVCLTNTVHVAEDGAPIDLAVPCEHEQKQHWRSTSSVTSQQQQQMQRPAASELLPSGVLFDREPLQEARLQQVVVPILCATIADWVAFAQPRVRPNSDVSRALTHLANVSQLTCQINDMPVPPRRLHNVDADDDKQLPPSAPSAPQSQLRPQPGSGSSSSSSSSSSAADAKVDVDLDAVKVLSRLWMPAQERATTARNSPFWHLTWALADVSGSDAKANEFVTQGLPVHQLYQKLWQAAPQSIKDAQAAKRAAKVNPPAPTLRTQFRALFSNNWTPDQMTEANAKWLHIWEPVLAWAWVSMQQ